MKTTTLHVKIVVIVLLCIVVASLFHVWFGSRGYNGNQSHNNFHIIISSVGPWQQASDKAFNQASLPPTSSDALVRAVYYDDRSRGGHNKMAVFLIALRPVIFNSKLVTGCGIGNEVSTNFRLRDLEENRLMRNWLYSRKPHFAYEEFIIDCYDIHNMKNGSKAFILFKTASNSPVYSAVSEYPLMLPSPRIPPTGPGGYDFSVVTCTEAHNKRVSWMPQFIRYQKTIGVDHVHMNILDTYIKDGGLEALLKDPQVAKDVAEGYVTMTVWKDVLESSGQIYSFSATLRKLDCIYRFRGTYDFAFLLDSDDFFTPMIHGRDYVKDYMKNWCLKDKSAGSCYFTWWFYFPESCGLKNENVEDGNITRELKSYKRTNNNKYKSVHLISAVVDTGYHHAICRDCLLPGYKPIHVDQRVAYMAHLRKFAKPPGGVC